MVLHRRIPIILSYLSLCVSIAMPGGNAYADTTRCTVKVGLGAGQKLAAAQFTIDYSRVQGTFVGRGLGTDCQSPLPGVMITANDDCDGEYEQCQWGPNRLLRVAILDAGAGFTGPGELARCVFETAETPTSLDFAVAVEQAAPATDSPNSEVPTPLLDILSVDCSQ